MDETDTDLQDTGEQAALRETVRDFCRAHAGAGAGTWKRLAGELGLTALAIGEQHGGMGATVAEVAIAAEELGRVLLPVPYLSTLITVGTRAGRGSRLRGADSSAGAGGGAGAGNGGGAGGGGGAGNCGGAGGGSGRGVSGGRGGSR